MYVNPHLKNSLFPTIPQIKKYIRLADDPDFKNRDVRPLMSFLQRLPQDQYFFGLQQTRKLAVTSFAWEITFPDEFGEPTDQERQQLNEMVKRFKKYKLHRLFSIVLNAKIFGIAGARIAWENIDGEGSVLKNLEPFDLTELDIIDGENNFVELSGTSLQKSELDPLVNILFYDNPLYGIVNNYAGGLARVNMVYVLLKYYSRFDWSRTGEKFGQPLIYATYGPGAEDKVAGLLADLEKLGSDGYAAIPDNIKVELLEAMKSGSIDLFDRFIAGVNSEMAISVLGQNLTTEISDQGSRAAAEVHNLVRQDILFSDLLDLENVITWQYLQVDYALNYGEPRNAYPVFKFITDEREDFEANSRIIAELKSLPNAAELPLKRDQVYDKIGFTKPDDDDEVF